MNSINVENVLIIQTIIGRTILVSVYVLLTKFMVKMVVNVRLAIIKCMETAWNVLLIVTMKSCLIPVFVRQDITIIFSTHAGHPNVLKMKNGKMENVNVKQAIIELVKIAKNVHKIVILM